ncbi:DUF192 domain-containing protein [Sphingomonas sp. PAMC 26605]|uniref:DUF192 domain-containing protein n=1 Tax=Sphingomonas sp. PAMC 26605 TaxID=1112214 RepID=UPI00026CC574|nr:DUF192 domain-containing protein [Sphingomonas sp. PAMC 26605]
MKGALARAAALAPLLAIAGCDSAPSAAPTEAPAGTIALTIASASGAHRFAVEVAKTEDAQQRGLMYRTDIPRDGGMLFAPYPPKGPPREASFWMKNTPSPLDIVFIRPDGTIARIAENTVPQSETQIPSGEPVSAVLELRGGRALDLGISEGDRVSWPGRPAR